jgi:hypothetical protein
MLLPNQSLKLTGLAGVLFNRAPLLELERATVV